MAEWQSIHLNHKDRALHGFYAYQVAEDGALKVLKNGRECSDKRVLDFIRIAMSITEKIKSEASEAKPGEASEPEQSPQPNGNTSVTENRAGKEGGKP